MASQRDYTVAQTAAMTVIKEVEQLVPGMLRGMIPVDKEPALAAHISKVVVDAVDADRAKL